MRTKRRTTQARTGRTVSPHSPYLILVHSKGQFVQVMQRQHHHRCYLKWQETLQVPQLFDEVSREVREMHEYLLVEKDRADRAVGRPAEGANGDDGATAQLARGVFRGSGPGPQLSSGGRWRFVGPGGGVPPGVNGARMVGAKVYCKSREKSTMIASLSTMTLRTNATTSRLFPLVLTPFVSACGAAISLCSPLLRVPAFGSHESRSARSVLTRRPCGWQHPFRQGLTCHASKRE